jgi:hypothetical protein
MAPPASPLRLVAEDADDLKAISALLQDAVLKVGDMAYLPKTRRFAMVLNRYRWEAGTSGGRGTRVRAGLRVDNVLKAESQRIPQTAKDTVLSLLALSFDGEPGAGGLLTLNFSAGKAVRLTVEALDVALDDLTEAWTAKGGMPEHGEG